MTIAVDDPVVGATESYENACELIRKTEAECADVRAHIDELKRSYAAAERSRILGDGDEDRCQSLRHELSEQRDKLLALEHALKSFIDQRTTAKDTLERAKKEIAQQEAIAAWNRLAGEHETALRRLEKGLREVAAAIELHQRLTSESLAVAEMAGTNVPRWDTWASRILAHTLRYRLSGTGVTDDPHRQLLQQQGITEGKHLWSICPYAQRIMGDSKVE